MLITQQKPNQAWNDIVYFLNYADDPLDAYWIVKIVVQLANAAHSRGWSRKFLRWVAVSYDKAWCLGGWLATASTPSLIILYTKHQVEVGGYSYPNWAALYTFQHQLNDIHL